MHNIPETNWLSADIREFLIYLYQLILDIYAYAHALSSNHTKGIIHSKI